MNKKSRKTQAKVIRIARQIHRATGILLFVFFFIVSLTTLLLGWKKHSGDQLLPETRQGSSSDLREWLSADSLNTIALKVMSSSFPSSPPFEVDRIEIRQDDGVAKFSFKDNYWGLQLDGATGEPLNIGRRTSDLIEDIHDGSILDDYLKTPNGEIKVVYTTIMGTGLLMFTITGFWLWYGPKRIKKNKNPKK